MHTSHARIATVAILACAAPVAHAQTHTQYVCEVSADYGQTWSPTLTVWPGQRVDVRVVIGVIGHTVQGLSGGTFQPVLSSWLPAVGDRLLPFTFPGLDRDGVATSETSYEGRHVFLQPGRTGRVFPFGTGSQNHASPSGVITPFYDPGDILRFAGSRATTPLANLAWGVSAAQYPTSLAAERFAYGPRTEVFRYAVVLAPRSTDARELVAVTPLETISGGVSKWYYCGACASVLNAPTHPEGIFPATIYVRARCGADISGSTAPDPRGPDFPPREGFPDGAVTIDDLLHFLQLFEAGGELADFGDTLGTGAPDGAVTIDDLLAYLSFFEISC